MLSNFKNSFLSLSFTYSLYDKLIGGDKLREIFCREYLGCASGQRVLDIGCGPGNALNSQKNAKYVGFDSNPDYISAAKRRYPDEGEFYVGSVPDFDIPYKGTYDRVMAVGVLHHLDDECAAGLFRMAKSALTKDGYLCTVDPALSERNSFLANMFIKSDRGEYIRSTKSISNLARSHFSNVVISERPNLLRVPYNHVLLQCFV